MDNIINVIVVGEESITGILADNLSIFHELRIVEILTSINSAKNISTDYDRIVVVYVVNDSEYFMVGEFLNFLKAHGIHSVFICRNVQEGFQMLEKGATEMIVKSDLDSRTNNRYVYSSALMKIKHVYDLYFGDENRKLKNNYYDPVSQIIGIGSSTGGTESVQRILTDLPPNTPPVLVVQHMPPVFTKLFAERLNSICAMSVWEARDGDELKRGLALIAPGDFHMTVVKRGGKYFVSCEKGAKVNGHCPSVDVLFDSLAGTAAGLIGIILTGMGSDGAQGLLKMRQSGAFTIGQDEQSSVVYGMPKVAFDIGAVARQANEADIARIIVDNIR